jgi:hypothetical protein
VLLAATVVAFHNFSVAVARVAAASEAFSGGVGSFALAFSLEVGEGVVMSPHESSVAFAFPLSFSFAFGALVELEIVPELSYRASGETAPGALCTSELKVDVLGGFCLGKLLQARNLGDFFVS